MTIIGMNREQEEAISVTGTSTVQNLVLSYAPDEEGLRTLVCSHNNTKHTGLYNIIGMSRGVQSIC